MESDISLFGDNVTLVTCTKELWHEIHKCYEPDPMMDMTPYVYDFERCDKAFSHKSNDDPRRYFAILHDERPVGEIYLKHIDIGDRTSDFGITLVNDSFKGKGFGTEAIRLLIDYTFNSLDIETITADSVLRNVRSHHVLEKVGFRYSHEDDVFKYYVIKKKSWL